MRIHLLIAVLTLAGWAAAPVRAAEADDLRKQAEAAYEKALAAKDSAQARLDFRKAADGYKELIAAGSPTGQLYYNLGNAYLGAGDVGRAVLNYRRAEKLRPGDSRVQAGLALALQKVEGVPARAPSWLEVLGGATLFGFSTRFWLGAGFYGLAFLLLATRRWFGKRWLFLPGVVCLLLGFWALLSAGCELAYDTSRPAGVVCGEPVVMRQGNGPSFAAVREAPLPAGCEFRVVQRLGAWQQIVLEDGTRGWIPEQPEV
jgi:tetratricopeptide (TPR) repeat protein